jgi:GH18 family chitinase
MHVFFRCIQSQESFVVIGYFDSSCIDRGFSVSQIDTSRVTHIIYAFANLESDGNVTLSKTDIGNDNHKSNEEISGYQVSDKYQGKLGIDICRY